jgi:predicted  nucleic acid-binding Zn-ribbon protein
MDQKLWELQKIDNGIAELRREKGRLDDGSAAREARDSLQLEVDAARAEHDRVEKARSHSEDELAQTESKLKRSQERLMKASSAHEVTSFQRDIEGMNRRRGELDEAVLTLMDELEGAQGKKAQLEARLAQIEAQLREIEKRYAEESSRLNGLLQAREDEREEKRSSIAPGDLARYDDAARRHSGVAIAIAAGGNCSACGTTLTPFNLKEARTQEWPTCENCARLLFLQ